MTDTEKKNELLSNGTLMGGVMLLAGSGFLLLGIWSLIEAYLL